MRLRLAKAQTAKAGGAVILSDDHQHDSQTVTGPRRILFLALAGIFTALGTVGAILPVLPTTPFLLLASFFLARSSPRLNAALLNSRFLGPVLRDWQEHHGIRTDVRMQALATVIIVLSLTIGFASPSTTISMTIAGLGLIGIVVILRLPRVEEPREQTSGDDHE